MKAGRAKADAVCAVRHGVDGLAKIPEAPNIAGQNENFLIEQLTAFKSGERKNEMMPIVSQNLSDADVEKSGGVLFGDRDFGRQGACAITWLGAAPGTRSAPALEIGKRIHRAAPMPEAAPHRFAAAPSASIKARSLTPPAFNAGGVPISHLRGQVARHFHAHADLANFRSRPCHGVVPSLGLAGSVLVKAQSRKTAIMAPEPWSNQLGG